MGQNVKASFVSLTVSAVLQFQNVKTKVLIAFVSLAFRNSSREKPAGSQ
jgi:hypothetical protein